MDPDVELLLQSKDWPVAS